MNNGDKSQPNEAGARRPGTPQKSTLDTSVSMSNPAAGESRLTLTPEQKETIRLQELYRQEIRRELSNKAKRGIGSRIVKILNSPLFIFLLSTVVVGTVSWQYTQRQARAEMRATAATNALEVLSEMKYRMGSLQKAVSVAGTTARTVVRNDFYSNYNDPAYEHCSLTCLADRLRPTPWLGNWATRLMQAIQTDATLVQRHLELVAPKDDPAPLTEAQVAALGPPVDTLAASVGRLTALLDVAATSTLTVSQRREAASILSQSLTNSALRKTTPFLSATRPGDIIGRWQCTESTGNTWIISIEGYRGHFAVYDVSNGSRLHRSPTLTGEFSYEGNSEFLGRHMWIDPKKSFWGRPNDIRVVLSSRDRIFIQYLDDVYAGGWFYVRDHMGEETCVH